METWKRTLTAGELVRRDQMLAEIRDNLIAVIQDYADLPPHNEALLTQQAQGLFSGDIVPSRDDWNDLNDILRELSTVKERGDMYAHFIRDVSDSLGVSDLERIRSFIDYIQTLPPVGSDIDINLNLPAMYRVENLAVQNLNSWSQARLTWDLSNNYLDIPQGSVEILRSASEDVSHYVVTLTAGSHREQYTRQATDDLSRTLNLYWRDWFTSSQLSDAWLKAGVAVTDKRGNQTFMERMEKYPSSVNVPQGVLRYDIQMQFDRGNWTNIGTSTTRTFTWNVPRVNGNYSWRVRAVDRNGQVTPWVDAGTRFIRFTPDPPSKPVVSVSTSVREATVTWTAADRADYYDIWHGGEQWAKDNSTNGRQYWGRVNANQTRRIIMQPMNEGQTYTWYVRAVNEGGQNTGQRQATMKRRVTKTAVYNQTGFRVWRGPYVSKDRNERNTSVGAGWRTEPEVYQGGWKEIVRSNNPKYPGWDSRGGGSYWAWGLQEWGNNMSFLFLNYQAMRNTLSGKDISSVRITVTRSSVQHVGWPVAKPLYLYNHNRENTTATGDLRCFRANGAAVTNTNQQALANITFNRGETEVISNSLTKQLIQNIVDGKMKGLGMVKYYGSTFAAPLLTGDPAYMRISPRVRIEVTYVDIE